MNVMDKTILKQNISIPPIIQMQIGGLFYQQI